MNYASQPHTNSATRTLRGRLSSRTGAVAVSIVAAFALAISLSGCGGDSNKSATFDTPTYPFSFEYPADWKLTRNAAFTYGSDAGVRSVSVALKNPYDQVTVTQYKLRKTLPAGVNGNLKEVDRIVKNLTKQANGTAGDAKTVTYGGIPGYQYVVEYPSSDGQTLRNTLTFLFQGKDEFQVNCQSSPPNRDAIDKGCDQVLNSLKFR